jgi:glycosyltransferase involved in cell wall biosynthesis
MSAKPLRVLYSHRIQSRDGQSVHLEEMVAALRALGHTVNVVGPGFYQQASFGGDSRWVRLLRRLLPGFLGELAELAYNLPASWRLYRACRAFRPDFIYERCNLYHLAGSVVSRFTGIPLLLEVNAPLAAERAKFGGLRFQRLAAALERRTWRAATCILPVTRVLGDILVEGGVAPERVTVIQNGVVLERFASAPRSADSKRLVLGFVGFVRDWHGLDGVIDALAREPEAAALTLRVVGDGPVRTALEAQARDLGISNRVEFTGLVPHDAVAAEVARFDIALQPAVTAYASPLKIFDYMAAGCAIVAPDQPNIREILDDGRTALLFPPLEPGAQWNCVRQLLQTPALRERLGRQARCELEVRDYTWLGNARRVAALGAAASQGAAGRKVPR